MYRKMKKNEKGFTLIELIVVMIIIGILVLLATPRFILYIEEARYTRIINDIRVVETVVVPDMATNNMEFPKGTEEDETDLSVFASENRAYMKDGLVVAGKIASDFIPEIGQVSETDLNDISTGYHKLDRKAYVKKETKTRLKGDFYINKEGYAVYVDEKPAKGESVTKEEFIDDDGLFLYDTNEPGTIIGLNFDHDYFKGDKNKVNLTNINFYPIPDASYLRTFRNPHPDETYKFPQIPDIRVMEGGKIVPVTKVKKISDKRGIVLYGKDLIFGENMKEIGDLAFDRVIKGSNLEIDRYQLNHFDGSVDFNNITKIGNRAFESIEFKGNFDAGKLETIGHNAFHNSKFTGDFDSKNLREIGESAFYYSGFEGNFDAGRLTRIEPNTFYFSIFKGSFDAKNLTYIGEGAFNRSKFTGNFDAKDIVEIDGFTFSSSEFTGNFDPKDLIYIGDSAFSKSEFTGHLNTKKLENIGGSAFENSDFDTILLGQPLKTIGENYFYVNETFGKIQKRTENNENIVGTEMDESGKLHSLKLPNLTYLGERALEGLKINGVLDIPNIIELGDTRYQNGPGFDKCDFQEIKTDFLTDAEEKVRFEKAVRENKYWHK